MVNKPILQWALLVLVIVAIVSGGAFLARTYQRDKQIAEDLANSLKRQDISVTIVEGKRREEIAAKLQADGITSASSFMAASAGDEGTLFPDTYRFFPNTPASEVVAKLENTYNERTASLSPTPSQLILASIVEREAANDTERPIIAEIYLNRVKLGMKLQADPTTQYAKDTINYDKAPSTSFTFWGEITQADYTSVQSPFNTYVANGLPPSPICNPGLKSIEAVLNPDHNNYLYFAHKNGQLLLATTLAQHEQQILQSQKQATAKP